MGLLTATCYEPFIPVPVQRDFVNRCHDSLQDWFWGHARSDGGEDGAVVDAKRRYVSHIGDGSNACDSCANLRLVRVLQFPSLARCGSCDLWLVVPQ